MAWSILSCDCQSVDAAHSRSRGRDRQVYSIAAHAHRLEAGFCIIVADVHIKDYGMVTTVRENRTSCIYD